MDADPAQRDLPEQGKKSDVTKTAAAWGIHDYDGSPSFLQRKSSKKDKEVECCSVLFRSSLACLFIRNISLKSHPILGIL